MQFGPKRGFSLTEVMTASTMVAIVSTAAMGFFVQSIKSGNATEQRIVLQSSLRTLTNEMVFTGSRAQEVILYNSAKSTDRTFDKRKVVLNTDTATTSDDVCPTGDFVLFVFYELPKPANQPKYRIAKLVGYYLDDIDSGLPALTRMVVDLTAAPSKSTVEEILNQKWATAPRRVLAPRVNALALSDNQATGTAPQLFYKRANQNLAICGQLLQSNAGVDSKNLDTQSRTFYFNITVRS